MAKRLTLVVYDALSVIVLACLLSCAVVVPAYAYIDPSVMTYTIQAVAGVAVALSTLAGVALRRGRKTLMRVLDIDENARREIEADVHRTGPDGAILREDVNAKVLQPAFDLRDLASHLLIQVGRKRRKHHAIEPRPREHKAAEPGLRPDLFNLPACGLHTERTVRERQERIQPLRREGRRKGQRRADRTEQNS